MTQVSETGQASGSIASRRCLHPDGISCGGGDSRPPASPSSHSKKRAPQLGVVADALGTTLEYELPVLQDVGALRYLEALHHVLLDQQDRPCPRVDAPDQGEHLLDQERREAERGLVEDKQPRLAPSARARWPASAARRPRACRRAGAPAPPAAGRSKYPRAVRSGARGRGDSAEIEILAHRHIREDLRRPSGTWIRPALDDVGGRRCPMLVSSKRMVPRQGCITPDGPVERRLADAVRAQHRNDLAGPTVRSMPRSTSVPP